MKITKRQLKRIIKEERSKLIKEARIRNIVKKVLTEVDTSKIHPWDLTRSQFDSEYRRLRRMGDERSPEDEKRYQRISKIRDMKRASEIKAYGG